MFYGSEEEARERLERMVSAETEPALDAADINELLEGSKRADRDGLAPSDEDWAGAWDLDAATAEGMDRKADRVAHRFPFSSDGRSFSPEVATRELRASAQKHRDKVVGSAPTLVRRYR